MVKKVVLPMMMKMDAGNHQTHRLGITGFLGGFESRSDNHFSTNFGWK
jgi:hypothetical protein